MDPTTEVALALHGAPGVYAVLLGSGVSRAAQIPTGWDVVLDLIRQLGAALGDGPPENPADWYHRQFGREADYSEILEQLAATPDERQALLRAYFEPTDEEREDGAKVPSAAHHAVADLARRGVVRVVLTTNFDRLIEQALDAAGVAHDVWSTPDAIEGGVPLVHGNVLVVKLHGDYRDVRIRNTLTELEAYDDRIDQLLDRVLDEFGLIVCGWSGVWDAALRSAIMRAKGRRYRTFWAAWRGEVADKGQELVDHRGATVVPIEGADEFFVVVNEKVAAIAEARRTHPASVEVALATVKRLLPDRRDRIKLADLILDEARRASATIGSDRYPRRIPEQVTSDFVAGRATEFAGIAEMLSSMLVPLVAYGDRADQTHVACRALEIIANQQNEHDGNSWLASLRRLPALICFYAAGIAAVATERWAVLHEIAVTPRWQEHRDEHMLAAAVHPFLVVEDDAPAQAIAGRPPGSGQRYHAPMSRFLFEQVRDPLRTEVDRDERFATYFDRFEYLLGVLVTHLRLSGREGEPPVPLAYVGRIRWSHRAPSSSPVADWADEHAEEIAPQLFGQAGDAMAAWKAAKAAYDESVDAARRHTMTL